MRPFSLWSAATAGVGLIIRRPLTVFVWGLLLCAPAIASFMATFPAMTAPETVEQMSLGTFLRMQAWSGLSNVLGLAASAIVGAAIIRLTLWRGRWSWAGLRVGVTEFLYVVTQSVVAFGLVVVIVLWGGLTMTLSYALYQSWPSGWLLGAGLFGVVGLGLFLWLWARSGLISVMTVHRGAFAFEEGWRLTRGHEFPLIAMAVVSALLGTIIFILFVSPVVLVLNLTGTQDLFVALLMALPVDRAPTLDLGQMIGIGIGLVLAAFGVGASSAVVLAPWARAYEQLKSTTHAATVETP